MCTPRVHWPSPPGSSPASADGTATTASRDQKPCASGSKPSSASNLAPLWGSTMCESDSRLRGEIGVRASLREAGESWSREESLSPFHRIQPLQPVLHDL